MCGLLWACFLPDNIKCFTKFWAKEKERIHVATLRFRGMSRQFAGLKWRVASSYQGTTAQAEGEAPYLHPTAMVCPLLLCAVCVGHRAPVPEQRQWTRGWACQFVNGSFALG